MDFVLGCARDGEKREMPSPLLSVRSSKRKKKTEIPAKLSLAEIRTPGTSFKGWCDNHYTTRDWFNRAAVEKSGFLNEGVNSDNFEQLLVRGEPEHVCRLHPPGSWRNLYLVEDIPSASTPL